MVDPVAAPVARKRSKQQTAEISSNRSTADIMEYVIEQGVLQNNE